MRAELLGVDATQWASFLRDTAHDFYHLPAYVALCAAQEGGSARALLVQAGDRGVLLPLIVRPIPGGGIDATSPYGYPGPLTRGTTDPHFVRDALQAGIRLLESQGIVSLFVRLHPLLNPSLPDGVGTVVTHGETVSVDLALSSDALWRRTRQNHRRDINRAMRAGYTARIDDRWAHFETFKQLYRETMERHSADSRYLFDDCYFLEFRAALGPSLTLWVVEIGETVAAAALFVETCGIVQYHLSGTDERFASARPTKLLMHVIRGWAKDRGNYRMHLGGGVGGADDSLLHFKAGFSPERHPFRTLRVVVADREYARLVAARNHALDATEMDGFFPLYRKT